eukprot:CAMPEP_0181183342 /NCGR_PEP_ID=MMETSP1096-20121128/8376_1 /TAXON_ID=156174 ORGANISM="Chrysochromulina ericina, Strain CCMP281" /NCGR_SAMPLE_ID=MMETSP1096 /ASSEMBLY_ACC=CAM_ASM_000453 /LENGTH=155 /DNA_ID=CAMNT_0023272019 /DNA_START=139 /DNA_END=604 /DNA_ORIENTATION=+
MASQADGGLVRCPLARAADTAMSKLTPSPALPRAIIRGRRLVAAVLERGEREDVRDESSSTVIPTVDQPAPRAGPHIFAPGGGDPRRRPTIASASASAALVSAASATRSHEPSQSMHRGLQCGGSQIREIRISHGCSRSCRILLPVGRYMYWKEP